jgi:TetR/AcrR family transcriptional regulator
MLQRAGVAAPVDADISYYLLVGGASIPYINAPEVRLLTGRDPSSPKWIAAHADALKTILLPGLASATT